MAEIWKPKPIEVYQNWIESIIEEASDNLNDWENTFIESLTERLGRNRNLTELQAEKLESIYVAKTK